jgi:hypothetical protein
MLGQRYSVRTVFIADKGLKTGEFAVIPIAYDGSVYTFTVCQDNHLFICNNANVIHQSVDGERRILHAPLGKKIEFWGIAASDKQLYLFCSDYTIAVMDWQGRERFRYKPSRIGGAPPFPLSLTPAGHLLVASDDYEAPYPSLKEYDSLGKLVREYQNLKPGGWYKNFAFDPRARLCLFRERQEPKYESGIIDVFPPDALLEAYPGTTDYSYDLIGIDRWGSYYWTVGYQTKVGGSWVGKVEVARTRPDQSLAWKIGLVGSDSCLPMRGKYQIDWLEVDSRGRIYVFAWAHKGIKNSVVIYRITVLPT